MEFAIDNRLTGVAILVDEAVGAPGQVVFERIGRVFRQCAHADGDPVHRPIVFDQMMGDDLGGSRSQTAMGD